MLEGLIQAYFESFRRGWQPRDERPRDFVTRQVSKAR
jgi:hypothetical protein